MWKKVFLFVGIIIVLIIGIEIFNISKNKENENFNDDILENKTDLSSKYVIDECLNEWQDYSFSIQEEIKETSQVINDENRSYILKEEEGVINIYYINENKEEILYRVTDISTKYLEEEDRLKLKGGINVNGMQELNKILEDFE